MSEGSNGIGGLLGTAIGVGFGLWGLEILGDFSRRQRYSNEISYILSLSQPIFPGSPKKRLLVRKQKSIQAQRILERNGYKIKSRQEVERGIILIIFELR